MTRRSVYPIHPVVIECRAQGRTVKDLSVALGYRPRTISGVLSSRTAWPRLRVAIAEALGKPVEDLFPDELAEEARVKPWQVTA